MKKSFTAIMILVMSVSFIASIHTASADFSVNVYINGASYGDYDQDGYQDDIEINLTIELSNQYVYTDIDIYVGVTLPSGQDFWFGYSFTAVKYTYTGYVDMKWDLMNTALESGWYRADAVGFAKGEQFSLMDSLHFDPPGQAGGLDPPYGLATTL